MKETPMETLLARGQYATVRAEYKELMTRFTDGCESIRHATAYALKALQDGTLDYSSFDDMRQSIDELQDMAGKVEALAHEAEILRKEAW